MDEQNTSVSQESIGTRACHFLQDSWPTIYRMFNTLLFGIFSFLKDTISGLWRKW